MNSSPESLINPRFSTEHLSGDLKRLSVRGGMATIGGQGLKFILQLGSTMVLARLLTPQDFGLIAMVTAVTGFILVFKDLGLAMATVQRAEINHDQISTLFWINLALSAALMLITLAIAPVVAWFYKDPRLIAVTAVLSVAFLFGGLTVQHQALLRRQMGLTAVATIDVLAMAAGILTALICAWAGEGYWSLVWMQIATAVTNAAGVWIASGWIPGRPVRRSGVRSMLKFGGHLTGFGIVNYFARSFDSVLIGRFCGAQALGLYSRAYSLLMFPIGQITAPMTAVAVPALSRLQNEPERYRSYYLKAIRIIAYLSFPLVVAIFVLSNEVVSLLLGNQWLSAIPIFRILAITAMFQPIGSTVGWIYVSLGQTKRMAIWGMIACPLIVASFVVGLPWGAIGVATSYAICTVIILHPQLFVAMERSPITTFDFYKTAFRPFCVSIVIGIGIALTRSFAIVLQPHWTVITSIAAGFAVSVITATLWPAVKRDLREIFGALDSFWYKRKPMVPNLYESQ